MRKEIKVYTVIYRQPYDQATLRMATVYERTIGNALAVWRREWPGAICVTLKEGSHPLPVLSEGTPCK